jgi:hypothetical protein
VVNIPEPSYFPRNQIRLGILGQRLSVDALCAICLSLSSDLATESSSHHQIHNAFLNNIAGMHTMLNSLSRMFSDSSWSRDNMQSFFKLIERNLYLQPNTSEGKDHGFDGWLSTTRIDEAVVTDGEQCIIF